jgi:hypothetical protein
LGYGITLKKDATDFIAMTELIVEHYIYSWYAEKLE